MINEDTFNGLSASDFSIVIDDMDIEGHLQMNRLLLAPDFKLALQVPLTKTVVIESKMSKMSAQERKDEQMKAKKGRKNVATMEADKARREADAKDQVVKTHVGYVEVELNLQRGDTEEELERNYQMKLRHQEEVRKQ